MNKKIDKSFEILDFINDYKNYLLSKEIFLCEEDMIYFFTMGGCYIFARILIAEFPEVKLMIDKNKYHCKVKYYNKNYDIYGFEYSFKDTSFKRASRRNLKYIKNHFSFSNYNGTNIKKNINHFENSFITETRLNFHFNNLAPLKEIKTITICKDERKILNPTPLEKTFDEIISDFKKVC